MASSDRAERWIWLEPIGFDNTQADYGAAEYIAKAGFTPDAVCLLMSSPDIVLQHPGMEQEVLLAPDICSRDGHTHNQERERQDWTNYQLRGLVGALKDSGVQVFLSFFGMYAANRHHREWLSDYPELLARYTFTEQSGNYNLLKRLRNGEYFEDVFVEKLAVAIEEYGFDGWHGADGNGPLMGCGALYVADFSNDMIAQFVAQQGVELPPEILQADGNVMAGRAQRAEYIWRYARHEWITFWSDRWAAFWRKALDRLHAVGKKGVINNAWARAPWESLYRYGIDYRKIVDAGVDAIVVESVAAGLSMDPRPGTHDSIRSYDMYSMLHLMRAYVSETKLVFLLTTQDIVEQWDAIRHAPTVLEREIFNLNNLYLVGGNGALRPAADGSLACLGDGIRKNEWDLLSKWWNLSVSERPRRVLGATLLWSDAAMRNQIEDFTRTRSWNTHRLLFNLLNKGAPVQSVVRTENLDKAEGPLLWINPHLFTAEEQARVAAYAKGAVIAVGPDLSGMSGFETALEDTYATRPMRCALRGVALPAKLRLPAVAEPALPGDVMGIIDKHGYWDHFVARGASDGFLKACADAIMAASGGIGVEEEMDAVTGMFMDLGNGVLRVALKNKMPLYAKPRITVPCAIARVEVKTDYPMMAVQPEGNTFQVRVPPKGLTVVDVFLE